MHIYVHVCARQRAIQVSSAREKAESERSGAGRSSGFELDSLFKGVESLITSTASTVHARVPSPLLAFPHLPRLASLPSLPLPSP